MPSYEEVRAAIFGLDRHSDSWLDGFSSLFYQKTLHIIGVMLIRLLSAFFLLILLSRVSTQISLFLFLSMKRLIQWKSSILLCLGIFY